MKGKKMEKSRVLTPDEYLKEGNKAIVKLDRVSSIVISKDKKGRQVESFFDEKNRLFVTGTYLDDSIYETNYGSMKDRYFIDGSQKKCIYQQQDYPGSSQTTDYIWAPDYSRLLETITREYKNGDLVKERVYDKNRLLRSMKEFKKGKLKREYVQDYKIDKKELISTITTIIKDGKGRIIRQEEEKNFPEEREENKKVTKSVRTIRNAKGKMIRQEERKEFHGGAWSTHEKFVWTVRNAKGKIISQKTFIDFQGKRVQMEKTKRGFFSWIKDHMFRKKEDPPYFSSGTGIYFSFDSKTKSKDGTVVTRMTESERKKTNEVLEDYLKDGSLSGEQKKTLMRKKVAEFRSRKGFEAPNKKVEKTLEKYLPAKGKEGR